MMPNGTRNDAERHGTGFPDRKTWRVQDHEDHL